MQEDPVLFHKGRWQDFCLAAELRPQNALDLESKTQPHPNRESFQMFMLFSTGEALGVLAWHRHNHQLKTWKEAMIR